MPSDLYKMGRVMELDKFITRVRAAVLQQASTMALGGTPTPEKNFAIFSLKNPSVVDESMVALVAADPTVLSSVTMVDDALADVEAVPDADIKTAVTNRWSLVSAKYPVTP